MSAQPMLELGSPAWMAALRELLEKYASDVPAGV